MVRRKKGENSWHGADSNLRLPVMSSLVFLKHTTRSCAGQPRILVLLLKLMRLCSHAKCGRVHSQVVKFLTLGFGIF